jgi:hypothetical protein
MYENMKTVFIVLLLLVFYFGVSKITLSKEIKKAISLEYPEEIGLNEELKEQIDLLEQDISRRMSYEIALSRDPLNLNKIVNIPQRRGSASAEKFKAASKLRLSCTMISPGNKSAVMKYKGKSKIVSIGDVIAGSKVVSIDAKEVVLLKDGKKSILRNKPAPTLEEYNRAN